MLQKTIEIGTKKVDISASKGGWTFRLFDRHILKDTFQARSIGIHDTGCVQDWLSRQGASTLGVDTVSTIRAFKKELGEYH